MNGKPITILCVDDNTTLAESIQYVIEADDEMQWLGHLPCADNLIDSIMAYSPRVLLLDLAMPGKDAFEAMQELQRRARELPEVRVIVLSGFVNPNYIQRALDFGAWGYVVKHHGPEAVIKAIRRVNAGEIAFPEMISPLPVAVK